MYNSPLYAFLWMLLLSVFAGSLQAQSVADLEARLKRATSKNDKLTLNYQLAEKLMAGNPAKAATYAATAAQIATEVGDKRKEADAIYLSGEGYYRNRSFREASTSYSAAWNAARNYGLRDVALNATERLQDIALKQNDYKEALKWSRETVNYLKEAGGGNRGGGDAVRRLEDRLAKVEAENRRLNEQLGQTQAIESAFRQTEAQLKETQEKSQQEIIQKQAEISKISIAKMRSDSVARTKESMVEFLSKEQLADSILLERSARLLEEQRNRVAQAELAQQRSDALRNLLGLLSLLVLVLAGAFYMRYRAKRKAADDLAAKNAQIEEERRRSDELLLNILPPAVAKELKQRNKVSAHKYEKATVMFIDFIGFTKVAEKLSPERLVEELDFCFSNFDRIISNYRIEKIKTIGDAYMCASGLSDMNASPSDIIKAGLEIQDFLQAHQAERMGLNLPYFEARIGVHVGPVVAGVVGAKKFAYDIWGDTVNIASRMEETCEPGRVNVSEDAYWLAKYDFEWQHRGKLAAKNKGQMDMYYVTSMKV